MVGYKLSKNDWVTPFFVIFRSVREILLVTVFLEHPVIWKAKELPRQPSDPHHVVDVRFIKVDLS